MDIDQVSYETVDVLVVSNSEIEKDWVMDSGCTFHVCPRRESLILNEGGVVMLGNNKPYKVQGMGSICLKMFNDKETLLTGLRYVPELKRNLISISMFDALGYTTRIEHVMMKIFKNSVMIAKGIKMNGLYILDGSTVIT